TSFNGDISNWDTSQVNTMVGMFQYATSFNGDISNWDTSNVTDMRWMFNGATSFSQDISNWDVMHVDKCHRFNPNRLFPTKFFPKFQNCNP
ncbi:MAG: BspA family leucine-rich repeat surface protein, partial [Flavobacteriaceae bacterium]|nr:BspA family leucine-rich repeat surface protein [Flavobacteriaceae bacterium]MCY4266998.1 BspA family leucine-rich repeat surface protein [Flavobacteriaceae bacterium]